MGEFDKVACGRRIARLKRDIDDIVVRDDDVDWGVSAHPQ